MLAAGMIPAVYEPDKADAWLMTADAMEDAGRDNLARQCRAVAQKIADGDSATYCPLDMPPGVRECIIHELRKAGHDTTDDSSDVSRLWVPLTCFLRASFYFSPDRTGITLDDDGRAHILSGQDGERAALPGCWYVCPFDSTHGRIALIYRCPDDIAALFS